MIRKSIYLLAGATAILFACYFLQPLKTGEGLDPVVRYELVENWPVLPDNLKLGNPTGVGMDSAQNLVVINRADRRWPLFGSLPEKPIQHKTILILNKENGKLMRSWDDNLFIMPHGLKVDNNNNIWVTDVGLHQVFKFSYDGNLLLQLGVARIAGTDSLHFNKPTDIAITKDGSFYIADGYGNSRIIKFSNSGTYLFEWGTKGDKTGQFNIPHGIALDENENVYVADRENNRIQVFTPDGIFIKQYSGNSFGKIGAVLFNNSKLFSVDDLSFLRIKHRGSDVYIFDTSGNIRTRFGRSGSYNGTNSWYHALAVDKDENIYIGDILKNRIQKFKKVPGH
jgi:peptidylamidoglycolate lyase